MVKYKTIIGRAESIDFTDLLLTDVPAKIDTGAYISSIHAEDIEEIVSKNGKKQLRFNLLAGHPSSQHSREIVVSKYAQKTIENSFGLKQERYVVMLKVRLAGKIFNAEFSLANRATKVFPILLGRTLLNRRFMVDTDIAHIDRKQLKVKLQEWLKKDDQSDDEETL